MIKLLSAFIILVASFGAYAQESEKKVYTMEFKASEGFKSCVSKCEDNTNCVAKCEIK